MTLTELQQKALDIISKRKDLGIHTSNLTEELFPCPVYQTNNKIPHWQWCLDNTSEGCEGIYKTVMIDGKEVELIKTQTIPYYQQCYEIVKVLRDLNLVESVNKGYNEYYYYPL